MEISKRPPLIPYASACVFDFETLPPAGVDARCHGTKLRQLWVEDGLSSDIASGVEMILVTPGLPCTTACACGAPSSLFV